MVEVPVGVFEGVLVDVRVLVCVDEMVIVGEIVDELDPVLV
jgi:hypothetical protein